MSIYSPQIFGFKYLGNFGTKTGPFTRKIVAKHQSPIVLSMSNCNYWAKLSLSTFVFVDAIYGFWLEITWCNILENICDRKL